MKIQIQRTKTWVPSAFGNDKLPISEQIQITYTKPNPIQRDAWNLQTYVPRSDGSLGMQPRYDMKGILEGSEITIKNLILVSSDNKEIAITTGRELSEAQSGVCSVIAQALIREIMTPDASEEQIKN